jgi:hypothetical protein
VLYNFGARGEDANDRVAGFIIDSKGNLYTATFHGGANGGGSVVELSPTTSGPWTEKVIYSFGSFSGDGRLPEAGLDLDANGNLYGTTTWGGKYGTNASNGGTVFELTPNSSGSWKETVLYNFGSSSTDGMAPTAGPILDSAGNVYTTTTQGGAKGQGTVFEVTPVTGGSWTGKILYSFGTASSDGATPLGGLVFDGVGNLYGTNYSAGAHGYGTVFELSSATGG